MEDRTEAFPSGEGGSRRLTDEVAGIIPLNLICPCRAPSSGGKAGIEENVSLGILKVNGLKKAFGIDELFHDVNFEVRGGDKVGLVGANGAGKTTLMKILMGQEEGGFW